MPGIRQLGKVCGDNCSLDVRPLALKSGLTLPAQPVDAIPSSLELLSKVVFMTQEERFGLSAVQKTDPWRRWKAGQSLPEIGRAMYVVFGTQFKWWMSGSAG